MNLLMVIFGLVGILEAVGTVQAVKERNILSVLFQRYSLCCFWRIYYCNNYIPRLPKATIIKNSFAHLLKGFFIIYRV